MKSCLSCLLLAVFLFTGCSQSQSQLSKPRIIVTCDPELDDHNSLIRYLLYSCDFDTEGLIYASSQFHWKGDGKAVPSTSPAGSMHGPAGTWARKPIGAGLKANVSSTRMSKPMKRSTPIW